ncbi:unnamed protein product [Calicophoron daubneyi]|uniref:Uncharacterized protein n=1 Tax=Calicophoron daubneyi TaxID=300641 RepID=A0AAV2TGT4_CALDB
MFTTQVGKINKYTYYYSAFISVASEGPTFVNSASHHLVGPYSARPRQNGRTYHCWTLPLPLTTYKNNGALPVWAAFICSTSLPPASKIALTPARTGYKLKQPAYLKFVA